MTDASILGKKEVVVSTTAQSSHIYLNYTNNVPVVIEPEDNDKFILWVKEVIQACRVFDEYKELFEQQLVHLKDMLGSWIQRHEEKITKACLTLQDARFYFLIVTNQPTYDGQIEDDLTDLELEVARDPSCSKIAFDVQALPNCEESCYLSFCNSQWVLEYRKKDA